MDLVVADVQLLQRFQRVDGRWKVSELVVAEAQGDEPIGPRDVWKLGEAIVAGKEVGQFWQARQIGPCHRLRCEQVVAAAELSEVADVCEEICTQLL